MNITTQIKNDLSKNSNNSKTVSNALETTFMITYFINDCNNYSS